MTDANATSLLTRLEKELRAIWAAPTEPGVTPMSRVVTMNLEVVAPSQALLDRYTPVVDEVLASVPARAILASVEPGAGPEGLDGNVSAVCYNAEGRKICSERIVLSAKGDAAARSASAIEAFLIPEIPTALVWLGPVKVDDPIFVDLANDANRILLDSEYASIASVIQVAAWARKQRGGAHVADLAWTRLASWHELLARFFDDVATRDLAPKISKLVFKQASKPGTRLGPELALMIGWIATRLGWKANRDTGKVQLVRPDGGNVVVEVSAVPCPAGVAPATLAMLTVEAGDMRGVIERQLASGLGGEGSTADADVIVWRREIAGSAPMEHHARLGANKAAKWLERTLHRPAHDAAFEESVAFAEQIVDDGLIVS